MRSPSASSFRVVPSCGTQLLSHARVKAATGIAAGPVNVELAGVVQSTWNFHRSSTVVVKPTKKAGEPAGGDTEPSRSEGSSPSGVALEVVWKH